MRWLLITTQGVYSLDKESPSMRKTHVAFETNGGPEITRLSNGWSDNQCNGNRCFRINCNTGCQPSVSRKRPDL